MPDISWHLGGGLGAPPREAWRVSFEEPSLQSGTAASGSGSLARVLDTLLRSRSRSGHLDVLMTH